MSTTSTASEILRSLRQRTGLSQRAFAAAAGTSGPTVAAYERGTKEPRLSTVERMADRLGAPLVVPIREDRGERLRRRRHRRRLAIAAATAEAVAQDFAAAVELAEANLARMEDVIGDNRARAWLDEWRAVLRRGPGAVRRTLLAPGTEGDDMRQMQPFAGLLSEDMRRAALAVVDALDAESQ